MTNLHMVHVKALWSNHFMDDRIKLTSARFKESVTIEYDEISNQAQEVATRWLIQQGHNVVGCGEVKDGYMIAIAADKNHTFKKLKG